VYHTFKFDHVYDQDSSQKFVYENTAKSAVTSVLEGYNATILAYGQTGTGKTFTMEGFSTGLTDPNKGIIPRSMEEIFKYIENTSNKSKTFMVRASYLQIYNEVITDLLKNESTPLQIRENKKKGVFVEGLSEWVVRTPHDIYNLMKDGMRNRATAATKVNDVSSRSHAVFIIIVEQMKSFKDGERDDFTKNRPTDYKEIKVGKLNLVDLAGSERVRVTGATGERLEESKSINKSLSSLGNVIAALTDKKLRSHIPYRDSKLTRILEDSLGGNCKTTMMAMISPTFESFSESVSTLKFATRAKKIKNEAKINEDLDHKALLRKYEVELKKLRKQLLDKKNHINDKHEFIRLQSEKKQAEEDKEAAISALEARSQEFLSEKQEKIKLEQKIKEMTSQLLIGGERIEDTPQFRNALEQKQKIIREEYEERLLEVEKERQMIEADKAQVDRYKQLLLKQRDIMLALTARINERDDTIIQLQEEMEAIERINKQQESSINSKSITIFKLKKLLEENG
jgi:GTPase SAR1 family protein